MKVIIRHSKFPNSVIERTVEQSTNIPRIGESISVFHEPWPVVKSIIWSNDFDVVELIVD